METQTDEMGDASTSVCEMTSNELPFPGHDGAHISVNAEESKVKHDHSYDIQQPPYVIFPTYEDDTFNAISPPPPLY